MLVLSAATVYALTKPGTAAVATHQAIHGVRCERIVQPAVHYHAHLDIFIAGRQVTLASQIGIPADQSCIYWLHTHDASGVIHIEAPASVSDHTFTLADFLAVWGHGPNLSGAVAIVNGSHYSGDPAGITLAAHELITLEVGLPVVPQPEFLFRAGL